MTKIKAVLFDMDGVLIDAKDWHYEALNRALALFGHEISRADHLSTYDGLPTRRKLEMLSAERGLPAGLHRFINTMKQQYTMELVYQKCKPVFAHEFALSKLKDQGYRLALCSNSIRNSIEVMLKKSNLLDHFDVILSNEDVVHSKPDPDIYITAMNRLEVEPSESLIVEDNDHGIKAAKASGGHLMAVGSVGEVNFTNIMSHIEKIERGAS